MDLGEFIRWTECWFYMDCCVRITNIRNWLATADLKMSEGSPFILNKYTPITRFDGILGSIRYIVQKYVGYYYGFFHMRTMGEYWNLNMAEEFDPSWINVLEKLRWSGLTNIRLDSCVLGVNLILLVMKGTLFVVV